MTIRTKELITNKISLPSYTFGEEMINSLSHAIGTGLSIAGLVLLLIKSISTGDPWKIVTSILFGTSLILLYFMSTLYHALPATIIKRINQIVVKSSSSFRIRLKWFHLLEAIDALFSSMVVSFCNCI